MCAYVCVGGVCVSLYVFVCVCVCVWLCVSVSVCLCLCVRLADTMHNTFSIVAMGLQSASSKKSMWRKSESKSSTRGSEQPVAKSVCGSLTMRQGAALAIIIRHRMSLNAQPSS